MMKLPYEQNKKTVIDFFKGNFGEGKLDELMAMVNDGSNKYMTQADFETWLTHSVFDAVHDFFEDNGVDVN
jgi:hypothetical protein